MDTSYQEHLKVLQDTDLETAQQFCKVALQLFRDGPQPKMIEKAAKKLDWTTEILSTTLEAIMELFKEAVKIEILPEDLHASLVSTGLQPAYIEVLVNEFTEHRQEIRDLLLNSTFTTTRLKGTEWRFEVEIASRTIHNEPKPHFLLRLDLETAGQSDVRTVQMDIPTLLHITDELDLALQEIKSTLSKKMIRHVK